MNDVRVFTYCPSSLGSVFSFYYFFSLSFPCCSSSRMVMHLICRIWSTVSARDQPRRAAHVWLCVREALVWVPVATSCANAITCCAPSPPNQHPPPQPRPPATGAVLSALKANQSLTGSGLTVHREAWALRQAALGVQGRWREAPWAPSKPSISLAFVTGSLLVHGILKEGRIGKNENRTDSERLTRLF